MFHVISQKLSTKFQDFKVAWQDRNLADEAKPKKTACHFDNLAVSSWFGVQEQSGIYYADTSWDLYIEHARSLKEGFVTFWGPFFAKRGNQTVHTACLLVASQPKKKAAKGTER